MSIKLFSVCYPTDVLQIICNACQPTDVSFEAVWKFTQAPNPKTHVTAIYQMSTRVYRKAQLKPSYNMKAQSVSHS